MKERLNILEIEKRTMELMITMYCRKHHSYKGKLCVECTKLKDYAVIRLDKCIYGKDKMACKKCKTHCYNPEMREQIIKVMRFAGPRMLYTHPIYTFYYIKRNIVK